MDTPLVERFTESADGTRIAYYVIGRGPRTWLMPPAMGAPLVAMRRVFERLGDECTFVTWDMRGFYRSSAPRDPSAYGVDRHVEDLEAVRAAANLSRFVLGGWSMAVPISLERVRQGMSDIEGLVLIHGPFRAVFKEALPLPLVPDLITRAIDTVGEPIGRRVFNPLSRKLLGAHGAARLLERARVLAANAEDFADVLAEFSQVDWSRYLMVLRHLDKYSAMDLLPRIQLPTLVTAGGRDMLTPAKVVERDCRSIPGAELYVVPKGTHYTPIEFPELLADRIRRFFVERLGRADG